MEKRTTPWGGHRSTTAAGLIAIMGRTRRDDAVFSDSDRALYTVCEFWAATMNRTLREHLAGLALLRLHAAEVSFAWLGIHGVAGVLHTARQLLADTARPLPLERVVKSVEVQLAFIDENVDQLIARFAKTQRQVAAMEYRTIKKQNNRRFKRESVCAHIARSDHWAGM